MNKSIETLIGMLLSERRYRLEDAGCGGDEIMESIDRLDYEARKKVDEKDNDIDTFAHWSDCAVHNEPAEPNGPCDCGMYHKPTMLQIQPTIDSLRAQLAEAQKKAEALLPRKIEYTYAENGDIILPDCAPFDGNPVMVKFAVGWCEAWWAKSEVTMTPDGPDYYGFEWVCCDDTFQMELDDASHWAPLPNQWEKVKP